MVKKMIVDRALLLQKKVRCQVAWWDGRAHLLQPGDGAVLPARAAPHSTLLRLNHAAEAGYWG